MTFQNQIDGFQIPGSVYYKILHMPEHARYDLLVGVKQMVADYREQIHFWKECWKTRDINAEKIENVVERFKFIKECCTGNIDQLLWSDRWKRIDANDNSHASAVDRAEYFDSQTQNIPKQKHISMIERMKRLGLLKDEPNFNKDAHDDFQSGIQLSRL